MKARPLLWCLLLLNVHFAVFATSDAPLLELRYGRLDPADRVEMARELRAAPKDDQPSYYIVQFVGPILPDWKAHIESLGAETMDYLPEFAYVVRMLPELTKRVEEFEYVRAVTPFHPAYRISPELLTPEGRLDINIQLFPGEPVAPVREIVRQEGGAVLRGGFGTHGAYVEVSVPARAVRRIASLEGVSWIERRMEKKLTNDVARGIMNVHTAWSSAGLYGNGEIVAMCDTGLDTGNLSTISADFAGRVFKTYKLGRPNKWDDPNGHGTHVAGSILGNGTLSGANPATHDYATSFAGVAPEAKLIVQSVLTNQGDLGGIPSDLNQLFLPPYNDGARIHTNSWGAAYEGAYTLDSRNLDMFTWNNKDMTVVMSAGNAGRDANSDGIVDLDSVDSPATAKNCITVGATENYRLSGGAQGTYGNYWPSDFPINPLYADKVSNNASGMVAFSSRGPCDDGRIKPDVCAPGTNIISCRSHASGASTLWGVYDANYLYCGGTSMSTPLVAGTCALVREYYRTACSHTPSSALVKATLMNGATDINPGQYGFGPGREIPGPRPNNVQGWGLVNASYLLSPTAPLSTDFVDYSAGLNTGGSFSHQFNVSGGSNPLRVTLVWSDYPAATYAAKALVNDLDLTVVLPNGTALVGNGAVDRKNNVEGVDILSPEPGAYTVTVSAYNVPYGPQPFALVISGNIGSPPPIAMITGPPNDTQLDGAVSITGTASGEGFEHYSLEYGEGESPSSWISIGSLVPIPVENGLLGIWNASQLAEGTYTLRLVVHGNGGTAVDQVIVHILRTRIGEAKANPDGSAVILTGKIVSADPAEFGPLMYVQEADRSSGLRVSLGSVHTGATIGSVVTVSGTLHTTGVEREIIDPVIILTGTEPAPIPLAMPNRAVGGAGVDGYNPGVKGGVGLNNLCLLVKTWGRVREVGSDYFYIEDGSSQPAIKVLAGSLPKPSTGQYAVVTGISSAEMIGQEVQRLLRPRTADDLRYY